MGFTHLEVHSHFTLLGATPSVSDLAARARGDGLTHLALTDTNALYGAVAFARACRTVELQPVIGMTLAVKPTPPPPPPCEGRGRQTPLPGRGGVGGEVSSRLAREEGEVGQLVLLVTGPAGYRSLCRLSSLIQGNPERETLAADGLGWDELAADREGLICLSGGRRGWIERYLPWATTPWRSFTLGGWRASSTRTRRWHWNCTRPMTSGSRRRWSRSADGWDCPQSPCSRSTA